MNQLINKIYFFCFRESNHRIEADDANVDATARDDVYAHYWKTWSGARLAFYCTSPAGLVPAAHSRGQY